MDVYQKFVEERGITRLIHFTKTKNLPFILGNDPHGSNGIVANNFISDKPLLEKIDEKRWDGKEDYICTSVQYPNPYYFKNAQDRDITLFKDWVIIEISPSIINESSLFCPFNAAKEKGKHIKQGIEAFKSIFNDQVTIQNRYKRYRNLMMPVNQPTDMQAEVMIYKEISQKYITGLIFPHQERVNRELLRLKLCGVDTSKYGIYYSEDFFNKGPVLKKAIEDGTARLNILNS